jgi:hypothetical protein
MYLSVVLFDWPPVGPLTLRDYAIFISHIHANSIPEAPLHIANYSRRYIISSHFVIHTERVSDMSGTVLSYWMKEFTYLCICESILSLLFNLLFSLLICVTWNYNLFLRTKCHCGAFIAFPERTISSAGSGLVGCGKSVFGGKATVGDDRRKSDHTGIRGKPSGCPNISWKIRPSLCNVTLVNLWPE